MPRPKQCPTYHVTLHKSKDFNCYKKKMLVFAPFQTISELMNQQKFGIWNLLIAYQSCDWTFQNLVPKWKKVFLLSHARYKINRSPSQFRYVWVEPIPCRLLARLALCFALILAFSSSHKSSSLSESVLFLDLDSECWQSEGYQNFLSYPGAHWTHTLSGND